jgi:hypothetical protein
VSSHNRPVAGPNTSHTAATATATTYAPVTTASELILLIAWHRTSETYPGDMADLHPGIAVLAPLLGTWTGEGSGEYPTIEPFSYAEEATFGHVGKPFLTYAHRTRALDDGRPLHAESGFVRMPSPGRIEWVLAHPTGITEVQEGTVSVDAGVVEVELTSTSIGRTSSAKLVEAMARTFRVDGDVLTYAVRMGAVGRPLQHHLAATLHRSEA